MQCNLDTMPIVAAHIAEGLDNPLCHIASYHDLLCCAWFVLLAINCSDPTHTSPICALQPATIRDFTINALFYNLNQGAVEDLTGRGLADLRAGLLRTPLPASETFLDGEQL